MEKVALEDMRNRIDGIDKQLVALYEERMDICKEVGQYKIETGKAVFDKVREEQKLDTVEGLASSPLNKVGIRELFEHIMSVSRKLQYRLLAEHEKVQATAFEKKQALDYQNARVIFQGAEGAYGQMALEQFFGEGVQVSHVDTFRDAMDTIANGIADYAVLPIENSSAGAVTQVYDLLVEYDNYIVGEVTLPITHTLAALKNAKIEDIKRVFSHPQALMQSEKYLEEHREMEQISMVNTAIAAQKVIADQDLSQAAICSEYAANLYGLKVLSCGINHNQHNSTRFIIVTKQKIYVEGANKISLCFEIPHESGSLYRLLSNFIYNDLNMTKIESRPIEGHNWEYRFFVDFEGEVESAAVRNALRGLQEEAKNLRILGNY